MSIIRESFRQMILATIIAVAYYDKKFKLAEAGLHLS